MATISLAAYTLRVKELTSGSYCQLGSYVSSKDLLDDLVFHLEESTKTFGHDEEARKMLKVSSFTVADRTITGIIKTGEYGFTSELLNVDSLEVAHERQIKEAEMLPFYFLFHLPPDADEGVIIFERFKTFGIRTLFTNRFESYFTKKNDTHRIAVNHLAPAKVFDAYQSKDGEIKEIRLISFSLPKPIEDRYEVAGHTERDVYIEFAIKAKRKKKIPGWDHIREYIDGKNPFDRLVEIPDFKSDFVKVGVKVNGKDRTLNLTDQKQIRANYDITNEVVTDTTGHPTFASIDEIAKGILEEQLKLMGKRLP